MDGKIISDVPISYLMINFEAASLLEMENVSSLSV
jgi:hypothetical protein